MSFTFSTKQALQLCSICFLSYVISIATASEASCLLFLSGILIFALNALYTNSLSNRPNQKIMASILIGLSTLLTIITLYFYLNTPPFETLSDLVLIRLFALLTLPLTFQLYYRVLLSIQYLCFKQPDTLDTRQKQSIPTNHECLGCTFLLATRNEPFDVCKLTFDSANQQDYPANKKEIIVVDNSDLNHPDLQKWKDYIESHEALNNGTRYKFIHREGTIGFKPKNLDIAMESVIFEHILLLDADSTLHPHTLHQCMPEFIKDPKLGFASLLIKGTNTHNGLFAKIGCISQNLLRYSMSLIGNNGFVIFQGHNAIWSKKTLNAIGPWLEYHRDEPMIVEDVAAATRCYFHGYYGKTVWCESGEWVPMSMKECESMWMRWTYGGMQIMEKYSSPILKRKNMTFKEKVDILNQMFSFSPTVLLLFAIISVIMPVTSLALMVVLCISQLPLIFSGIKYTLTDKPSQQSWLSWFKDLYLAYFIMQAFITWVSAKAVLNYILRQPQGWKPTGKKAGDTVSWQSLFTRYYGMILFGFVGLCLFSIQVMSWNSEIHWTSLICMIPATIFFMNLIIVVLFLGRSHIYEPENLDQMSIQYYNR